MTRLCTQPSLQLAYPLHAQTPVANSGEVKSSADAGTTFTVLLPRSASSSTASFLHQARRRSTSGLSFFGSFTSVDTG